MQKNLTLIAILLALTGLINACAQERENLWLTDFEAVKKMATEKKLPILADFSGSDWCGWCMKLDREVFSQKEFKEFARENLILFKADFPMVKKQDEKTGKQNEALSKKYAIEGFPAVLLMDAKGEVFAETGYERGGVHQTSEKITRRPKKNR